MNSHDLDSLRLLVRQRHEQHVREAETERFAREIRTTTQRRRLLGLRTGLALRASHLLRLRRLEG